MVVKDSNGSVRHDGTEPPLAGQSHGCCWCRSTASSGRVATRSTGGRWRPTGTRRKEPTASRSRPDGRGRDASSLNVDPALGSLAHRGPDALPCASRRGRDAAVRHEPLRECRCCRRACARPRSGGCIGSRTSRSRSSSRRACSACRSRRSGWETAGGTDCVRRSIWEVMIDTGFGRGWSIHLAAVACLVPFWLAGPCRSRAGAALASGLVLATLAVSGHAAAPAGAEGRPVGGRAGAAPARGRRLGRRSRRGPGAPAPSRHGRGAP